MNHYHQASLAGHYDDDEALFVNGRSEEHTSELQSRCNLVCRLLLEKKNGRRRRVPEDAIELVVEICGSDGALRQGDELIWGGVVVNRSERNLVLFFFF